MRESISEKQSTDLGTKEEGKESVQGMQYTRLQAAPAACYCLAKVKQKNMMSSWCTRRPNKGNAVSIMQTLLNLWTGDTDKEHYNRNAPACIHHLSEVEEKRRTVSRTFIPLRQNRSKSCQWRQSYGHKENARGRSYRSAHRK